MADLAADMTSAPRATWRGPMTRAVLSFVWPGWGHWVVGSRWTAVALALPQLLLLALAGLALASDLTSLLDPRFLLAAVIVDLVVLASRLYAVASSALVGPTSSRRLVDIVLVAVLAVASIGIQGTAAAVGWRAYDTLTTVFDPAGPRGGAFSRPTATASPTPTATPRRPSGPLATPEPLPTPVVVPDWAADGRFTMLLIGADAGPGRWKLRTDTMILLTVDVASKRAALIGIPRNVLQAPMPPPLDATFPYGFPDLLNALWVYVDEHPGSYPGDPAIAPFAAVQAAIGTLTGTAVDAMAVAELNGFVQAVDTLGGLDIDVPAPVYDARYPNPDGTGNVEISIPAGQQHLDGWHALAYARSRHQDGDYWRMERQQTVLVALQRQLRCQLISRIPDLLAIARDTLWTNLPLEDLPDVVQLARRVDPSAVTRITLTPPAYPEVMDAATVERIHALVANLFTTPLPSPTPRPSAASETGCP